MIPRGAVGDTLCQRATADWRRNARITTRKNAERTGPDAQFPSEVRQVDWLVKHLPYFGTGVSKVPSGARRSLASGELLVSQVSSDRLPLGAGGRRIQSMKVLQGGIDPPKSLTV